jgi:hypothetical protein
MIARHITTHDETGMRLLATLRDIYHTPTQTVLNDMAMELASRGNQVMYSQRRCLDGVVISKAYPCEGRMIVDSVYFSTADELHRLYARSPLGDGLFFANAPRLTNTVAVPSPASERLTASATFDEYVHTLTSLFPEEDMLAETLCALRTGRFPLALIGKSPAGEFSRKLYMALELMLRALPSQAAAKLEFVTLCGTEAPCPGATGYTLEDGSPDCRAFIYLPDGTRELHAQPSQGDYERADALLAGTLDDIIDSAMADDSRVHSSAPAQPSAQGNAQPEPEGGMDIEAPASSELERAQQMLSASLRYANSHEFRQFTAGFMKLRTGMEPSLYFRYCLMYSDFLHRLDHPMCEVYDAELAALYRQPPTGLLSAQVALTLTGYPGALSGAIRHLERSGTLESFINDAMPRMSAGDKPEEYALSLISLRNTLAGCISESSMDALAAALTRAVNESMPGAIRRVTAGALCSVRDALEMLAAEDAQLGEGAFDQAVSMLIDRIEFKRLDEFADDTYAALNFAYSYVRQWDGQVTDKQRAICLWGRLMSGCSDWHGCVMEGMLRLLAPMSPVNRVDFMGFVRRYFAALCDGGLERAQMSESVVMVTMLTALRFDSQNNWRIDELDDVLDKLSSAGDGLEREFWQQINTRVDLLPVDMLNAAHRIAGDREERALSGGMRGERARSADRYQREYDEYDDGARRREGRASRSFDEEQDGMDSPRRREGRASRSFDEEQDGMDSPRRREGRASRSFDEEQDGMDSPRRREGRASRSFDEEQDGMDSPRRREGRASRSFDDDQYGERRASRPARNTRDGGPSIPRFISDDDRREGEVRRRTSARAYDSHLAQRSRATYSEREGGARSPRPSHRRASYDYDTDDPDGDGAFADDEMLMSEGVERYRLSNAPRNRGISGETLTLLALALLAAGALAFCVVTFLL